MQRDATALIGEAALNVCMHKHKTVANYMEKMV